MLLLYFSGIIVTVVILTLCVCVCVCALLFLYSMLTTHTYMTFSGAVSGNISLCAEIAAKFCQRAASSAGVSLGQDHGC